MHRLQEAVKKKGLREVLDVYLKVVVAEGEVGDKKLSEGLSSDLLRPLTMEQKTEIIARLQKEFGIELKAEGGSEQGKEGEEEEEWSGGPDLQIFRLESSTTVKDGDVVVRTIRKKNLSLEEWSNRTFAKLQRMEEEEEAAEERAEDMDWLWGSDREKSEDRDNQLEAYLRDIFPNNTSISAEEADIIQREVLGRNAGGVFRVKEVINFDDQFRIFIGAPTDPSLSFKGMTAIIDKRLEYYKLKGKVELFYLKMPVETVMAVEDLFMETAFVSAEGEEEDDTEGLLRQMLSLAKKVSINERRLTN